MKENAIKAVLAAALGALASYGTQLIVPAIILVAVMVLDYITGMAKAWQAGELSSRVGIGGILKKVGYLVIVAVACVLDWLVPVSYTHLSGTSIRRRRTRFLRCARRDSTSRSCRGSSASCGGTTRCV